MYNNYYKKLVKEIVKCKTLDQWGMGSAPKVWRSDSMSIKPQDDDKEERKNKPFHDQEKSKEISKREHKANKILSKYHSIRKIDQNTYLVQSQSGNKWYRIQFINERWICDCQDFSDNGHLMPCKHIIALENRFESFENPYVVDIENIHKKKTYSQNWTAYNKAQMNEFSIFQDILIELLDNLIEVNPLFRRGRPFNDLKEMIFCCTMRSYYGKSSRRSISFLDYAVSKGYISKKPHFNTVLNYYKDVTITPILKYLIEQSASPLKDVEVDFSVDSSGFSTSLYGRWLDVRTKSNRKKRLFKKAHVTSGVKSNIITAIEVTPGYYADSPQFGKMIKITAKTFRMREVSADKAYSSRKNLQTVVNLGAIPFIPFRKGTGQRSRGTMIWSRMRRVYDEQREFFNQHYHKRSNAESVFNMMKRKFGTHLYSKSEVGQTNEVLCKALAHNICVLIQELHENDLKIDFNYCAIAKVRR